MSEYSSGVSKSKTIIGEVNTISEHSNIKTANYSNTFMAHVTPKKQRNKLETRSNMHTYLGLRENTRPLQSLPKLTKTIELIDKQNPYLNLSKNSKLDRKPSKKNPFKNSFVKDAMREELELEQFKNNFSSDLPTKDLLHINDVFKQLRNNYNNKYKFLVKLKSLKNQINNSVYKNTTSKNTSKLNNYVQEEASNELHLVGAQVSRSPKPTF